MTIIQATRPVHGEVYHAGCDGCVNPVEVCVKCMYFKADWKKKNRHQEDRRKAERRK